MNATSRVVSVHSWFCLVAAGPFGITALVSLEYGGTFLYASLAAIFVVQAFKPTLVGWGAVLVVQGCLAAALSYLLVDDLAKIVRGHAPDIFVDAAYAAVIVGLWAFACLLTAGIYRTRPRKATPLAESAT